MAYREEFQQGAGSASETARDGKTVQRSAGRSRSSGGSAPGQEKGPRQEAGDPGRAGWRLWRSAAYEGHEWWTDGRFMVSTDDAYVQADITFLSAKISGYVASVAVANNQSVKAGDLIAMIDDGDYRLALQSAKDKLATQQSASRASAARSRPAARRVRAGRGADRRAQARGRAGRGRLCAPAAARQVRRHQQAALENARRPATAAEAAVKSAQAALAAAQANVEVLEAQQAEARARWPPSCRPPSTRRERDLSFTVIRAPSTASSATTRSRSAPMSQPGTRLAALVPLTSVHVDANFKETQLAALQPGQKVQHRGRRLPGPRHRRHGRERRAGLRRGVQPAAAGERHRQLHQDRAARAGAHRGRRPTCRSRACCAPACRSSSTSTPAPRPRPKTASSESQTMAASLPCRTGAGHAGRAADAARPAPDSSPSSAWSSACSWRSSTSRSSRPRWPRSRPACRASADEISWVQTAYLIAEVIMIPLSGIARRACCRRACCSSISAAGFTAAERRCARPRPSIDQMIVYRALQGFIGGGMIPTVFAAAFTIFPPSKRPIDLADDRPRRHAGADHRPDASAAISPTLFSWHWLFLVNVVPGIVVTAAAWLLIDFDKPDLGLFKNFDWCGPRLHGGVPRLRSNMCSRKGPTNDWFQDDS